MIAGDMLVAAPERWDEACFAVPAVRALMKSGLSTGVACREAQREFWQTVPDLTVIDFPDRMKSKLIAQKISADWQASISWEPSTSAEAFKISRISRRLGPNERPLNKLLTHPFELEQKPTDHRVRRYLNTVEQLGIDTKRPEFFASADLGIEPEENTILLCPASDYGASYEWPLERWLEIAHKLIEKNQQLTIASYDGIRDAGKILADRLGDKATFFQAAPLVGTLPILAVHQLIIAADGSLPHLAAHAGSTCITLFGPNDATWKRPLGRRHSVARRHVECAPCLSARCLFDSRCQKDLAVEQVWQTILEKL